MKCSECDEEMIREDYRDSADYNRVCAMYFCNNCERLYNWRNKKGISSIDGEEKVSSPIEEQIENSRIDNILDNLDKPGTNVGKWEVELAEDRKRWEETHEKISETNKRMKKVML
tara:strand:+ start:3129 stop:3473 length:345 start_codon:yes stop_codon:yes gene_type:complete